MTATPPPLPGDADRRPALLTRRSVLRAGAAGAALGLATGVAWAGRGRVRRPAPTATYDFNRGWRFGGAYRPGAEDPGHPDGSFAPITLPHTVTRLSWGDWAPSTWEELWIYRKTLSARQLAPGRVLLHFDGAMTNCTVYLDGAQIAEHIGGYLPFSVELTDHLRRDRDHVLAVVLDGRPLDVPPASPAGDDAIDYLQPAGINRDVTLRVVPDTYVSDVFARGLDVLGPAPGLACTVTVDSSAPSAGRCTVTVELLRGTRRVAEGAEALTVRGGAQTVEVALRGLRGIALWSPDSPALYTVRVTVSGPRTPAHSVEVTTGFRHARFTTDGFFLNGRRLQIVGLNRHQLYPYTGMAASARMQARDAQLLRRRLNCNMVRCSHYPQSPHFLDECDRIGLMVWEEPPGWQYVGDESFESTFIQNVRDMVIRDRSRPSVVVWATRPDESHEFPTLFAQARALADELDGTRQTTGAMARRSTSFWAEDVFAYDDYGFSDGEPTLAPPLPGIPYLVSEAVGALDGPRLYRWVDPSLTLQTQSELHARVHAIARRDPAYCGVLAWCGIDYDSLLRDETLFGGMAGDWHGLRWPGVLDTFRVPKPGAAFYRSQRDPSAGAVIVPAFYWDFGPGSPPQGPGPGAMLATNCEALAIHVDGRLLTTATPDTGAYGSLPYPPVFADLTVDGATLPALTVIGYVGGRAVTSLRMSADPAGDHLALELEDPAIAGDGSDSTRLTFRAVDAFGNQRPYVTRDVTLSHTGDAAEIVGETPFDFGTYGGVGSVFLRSRAGRHGVVSVTASHPTLGSARATLTVRRAERRFL